MLLVLQSPVTKVEEHLKREYPVVQHTPRPAILSLPWPVTNELRQATVRVNVYTLHMPLDSVGLKSVRPKSMVCSTHLNQYSSICVLPFRDRMPRPRIAAHFPTAVSLEHFIAHLATPRMASLTSSGSPDL